MEVEKVLNEEVAANEWQKKKQKKGHAKVGRNDVNYIRS